MDGTDFVIGAGHMSFDDQGVGTIEVSQELRLLTATGHGHAVELDLSGMTQLAGPSNINRQELDGSEARWGTTCSTPEGISTNPLPAAPHCATAATQRISLRANLAAATPVANALWDALAPAADVMLPLRANDADGTPIEFQLALRKSTAETWDYHVLPPGEAHGAEVASGLLSYNPNGSLRSVTAARVLRFPNHDGVLGAPIELDFGASTDVGGNGVDGVTSLAGGSVQIWQQGDGAALDCLPRASAPPLPLEHVPNCAGERTTAISMYFNLDSSAPLSDADAYSTSVTVYDAALAPQQVELHFRHVAASHWQCDVVASSVDVGAVELYFDANGGPAGVENIPTLRFPLADGSTGPTIQLAFDADWAITAFSVESHGWLTPNGAAPNASGCVE